MVNRAHFGMEAKLESTTVWEENTGHDLERGAAFRIDTHGQPRPSTDISTIQAYIKSVDGVTPLKLGKDGHTVLIPQPSDNPDDPLNWPSWKKHAILLTTGFVAFSMDFQVGASISCSFPQAAEWQKSPNEINQANNVSVLMIGFGGILLMPFLSCWGRAPVSFWTVLLGGFFTLGCILTPSFTTYYALKCLQSFVLASGLVSGLAFIEDMFYFHDRARKIGIWTSMWLAAPYFGPMFSNFMVTRTHEWRNSFWLIFAMNILCLALILVFFDESFYRRDLDTQQQPQRGIRIWRIIGIWQLQCSHGYFSKVVPSFTRLLAVLLQPLVIPVCISTTLTLMWLIGINQSSSILLATPAAQGGYGFNIDSLSYLYFSPIVGIILGETFGHWFIDFQAHFYIRKHNGRYAPEARIIPIYLATVFMIPALVLLGQALAKKLSWVAIAFGWGIYTFGAIIEAVASTAYLVDSYPHAAGELSALLNFFRLMGGFGISYGQMDWGFKVGFDSSFGTQSALLVFATLIMVVLHVYGPKLRLKRGPVKL